MSKQYCAPILNDRKPNRHDKNFSINIVFLTLQKKFFELNQLSRCFKIFNLVNMMLGFLILNSEIKVGFQLLNYNLTSIFNLFSKMQYNCSVASCFH